MGESAVGFTFAPPVRQSNEAQNSQEDGIEGIPLSGLWPMFVLHGNGNVFCLVTGLGEARPKNCPLLGQLESFANS